MVQYALARLYILRYALHMELTHASEGARGAASTRSSPAVSSSAAGLTASCPGDVRRPRVSLIVRNLPPIGVSACGVRAPPPRCVARKGSSAQRSSSPPTRAQRAASVWSGAGRAVIAAAPRWPRPLMTCPAGPHHRPSPGTARAGANQACSLPATACDAPLPIGVGWQPKVRPRAWRGSGGQR